MAWEWSHTGEAYDYARMHLEETISMDILVEIMAEWDTFAKAEADKDDDDAPAFDQAFYGACIEKYGSYARSTLAGMIWERMEQQRTATNGGAEFWGCPYGCDCHLIPVGEDE